MEWYEALVLLIGSIMALMAVGMPVALAFLAANIIGAWIFMGGERGVASLPNRKGEPRSCRGRRGLLPEQAKSMMSVR